MRGFHDGFGGLTTSTTTISSFTTGTLAPVFTGAVTSNWTTGTNTDPLNDFLSIGNNASLQPATNFSIFLRAMQYVVAANACIAADWSFANANPLNARWAVCTGAGGTITLHTASGSGSTNGQVQGALVAADVPMKPFSVAATWDATNNVQRLYVNGIRDASANYSNTPTGTLLTGGTTNIELGRWFNQSAGTFLQFMGQVWDFRVHNVVLSDFEIGQLHGGADVARGLVDRWPLNGSLTSVSGVQQAMWSGSNPNGSSIVSYAVAEPKPAWPPVGTPTRVMFIGDSNVFGYQQVGTYPVAAGAGWAPVCAIMQDYYNQPIQPVGGQQACIPLPPVRNSLSPWTGGRSGDRLVHLGTDDMHGRLRGSTNELTGANPQVVVLMGGFNDINADNKTVANTLISLSQVTDDIYNWARSGSLGINFPVIVSSIYPLSASNTHVSASASYNASISALIATSASAGYNIRFSDAGRQLNNPYDFQSDGLHGTRGGHHKWAWQMAQDLHNVLPGH